MNGNHKESYFTVFTEVRLLSLAIILIDFIYMSALKRQFAKCFDRQIQLNKQMNKLIKTDID